MRNEKGTVLVETPIFVVLFLSFGWGVWKIHEGWKQKFQNILSDRNSKIKTLRMEKTPSSFSAGVPFFDSLGTEASRDHPKFSIPPLGKKESPTLRGE